MQRQEGQSRHEGRREEDAAAEAAAQRAAPGNCFTALREKTLQLLDEVDDLLDKGIDAKNFFAS